jgi:hypothetical protein
MQKVRENARGAADPAPVWAGLHARQCGTGMEILREFAAAGAWRRAR